MCTAVIFARTGGGRARGLGAGGGRGRRSGLQGDNRSNHTRGLPIECFGI